MDVNEAAGLSGPEVASRPPYRIGSRLWAPALGSICVLALLEENISQGSRETLDSQPPFPGIPFPWASGSTLE